MVEERFDRIERRLDGVEQRLGGVEQRLDGVAQRLGGVEQRLDSVEQRLDVFKTDVDDRFDELRRYMGVLHEDVLVEALVPVVREHSVTLRKHDAEFSRLKRRRR